MTNPDLIRGISISQEWVSQSSVGPLSPDEVHVWLASLEIGEERYHALWNIRSQEEMERAKRYRFEKNRISFVASRGILKTLLSGYLRMAAGKISFAYGPYGKPELAIEASSVPLRFNASHSNGLALFAFALDREIGVDIEYIRRNIDIEHIAKRFFSSEERAIIEKLPPGMKEKGFFGCWARKEAFLKAIGKGLSFGLDRVEVSVDPGSPASLLRITGSEEETALWSLHDLPAATDYSAALAVKGRGLNPCLWRWKGDTDQ
jgi:4'-phosphopantetheinyl transferase